MTAGATAVPPRHDEAEHRRGANRAVGVSALGLALTGGIELALAIFTGSVALLGDALHNLSDVSTSAVVFLGFRISKRKPTAGYPYGYERAEDLAGLGVALVIWGSAVFAGVESYFKLVGNATTTHLGIGMAGAVLGIVGNQVVARYKLVVGRRIQSATLVADARHSWLDALSSLGALVGLGLVALGYRWGDPIAGFAVTLFILHVGYEVTGEILHHLMDGVDADEVEAARRAASAVTNEDASVRGRWMGRSLLLEVEVTVPADVPVGAAETIDRQVQAAIFEAVPAARQVTCRISSATPRVKS
ncbi:MAG: cation diffusion facilitator family transporter [Candidatus Dormibacteraeota bacterium]|nr:cation diffusion facilitator family transporter [Candidatus Dormibacteraeota bacterium]